MVHGAHRLGVTVHRPAALDFVERKAGAGCDDQVIIGDLAPVLEQQLVALRVNRLDPPGDEIDVVFLQVGADRQGHLFAVAPANRQPGVGRYELKVFIGVDNCYFVFPVKHFTQFVGSRHTADTSSQYHNMSH